MDNIKFDKVEDGELLKWPESEVGKIKIVGVLKSYTARKDTGKGPGHVYEVQTKDGIVPFFAPSLLHKKLQNIPIGNIVSIEFTKITKTAVGNPLKHFEVGHTKPTEANLKAVGVEIFNNIDGDEVAAGF